MKYTRSRSPRSQDWTPRQTFWKRASASCRRLFVFRWVYPTFFRENLHIIENSLLKQISLSKNMNLFQSILCQIYENDWFLFMVFQTKTSSFEAWKGHPSRVGSSYGETGPGERSSEGMGLGGWKSQWFSAGLGLGRTHGMSDMSWDLSKVLSMFWRFGVFFQSWFEPS